MTSGLVAVDIDECAGYDAALRFGLDQALLTGAALRLVHVVPGYVPVSPMLPMAPADYGGHGLAVLREAHRAVHDLAPAQSVEVKLCRGARVRELVRVTSRADLLVTSRDLHGLPGPLLVHRDLNLRIAARSAVPVVTVPSEWGRGPSTARAGVVAAAVLTAADARDLLGVAFDTAHLRSSALLILHAGVQPGRGSSERPLDALVREWRARYPDVDVRVQTYAGSAPHCLLEACGSVDLMLLGRSEWARQYGPTVRALIRRSACPVMVVPRTAVASLARSWRRPDIWPASNGRGHDNA